MSVNIIALRVLVCTHWVLFVSIACHVANVDNQLERLKAGPGCYFCPLSGLSSNMHDMQADYMRMQRLHVDDQLERLKAGPGRYHPSLRHKQQQEADKVQFIGAARNNAAHVVRPISPHQVCDLAAYANACLRRMCICLHLQFQRCGSVLFSPVLHSGKPLHTPSAVAWLSGVVLCCCPHCPEWKALEHSSSAVMQVGHELHRLHACSGSGRHRGSLLSNFPADECTRSAPVHTWSASIDNLRAASCGVQVGE